MRCKHKIRGANCRSRPKRGKGKCRSNPEQIGIPIIPNNLNVPSVSGSNDTQWQYAGEGPQLGKRLEAEEAGQHRHQDDRPPGEEANDMDLAGEPGHADG